MSRHSKDHPNNPSKILVYGFDFPLGEFFWQEWDSTEGLLDSSLMQGGCTKDGFLGKLEEYGLGVGDSHYDTAAMDLAIDNEPNERAEYVGS